MTGVDGATVDVTASGLGDPRRRPLQGRFAGPTPSQLTSLIAGLCTVPSSGRKGR